MKVVYAARARQHMKAIRRYIARKSYPSRADAYVNRLFDYCEGLANFPERGSKRDDILEGLRMVGFEQNATIAFTVTATQVIIEGIFYGGRDIAVLHQEE